jgi:hypothetical protein
MNALQLWRLIYRQLNIVEKYVSVYMKNELSVFLFNFESRVMFYEMIYSVLFLKYLISPVNCKMIIFFDYNLYVSFLGFLKFLFRIINKKEVETH